ncbi:hypothetical protein V7416_24275, partial [Priestia megaterium]
LSYAGGGGLARELGSWQVIAWAIIIGAPFAFTLASFMRTPVIPFPLPQGTELALSTNRG